MIFRLLFYRYLFLIPAVILLLLHTPARAETSLDEMKQRINRSEILRDMCMVYDDEGDPFKRGMTKASVFKKRIEEEKPHNADLELQFLIMEQWGTTPPEACVTTTRYLKFKSKNLIL